MKKRQALGAVRLRRVRSSVRRACANELPDGCLRCGRRRFRRCIAVTCDVVAKSRNGARSAAREVISVDTRPGQSTLSAMACDGSRYTGVGTTTEPKSERISLVGANTRASGAGMPHDDIVFNPIAWKDARAEGALLRVLVMTQTPNVTRALPPVVWSARGSGYRTNNYIRSNPYRTVRLKTYHLLSQLPRGLQGNRISRWTEIFVQGLCCSHPDTRLHPGLHPGRDW